jgi:inner membrane protein
VARAIRGSSVARVVVPPLAVLAVVSLDLVSGLRSWPIPVTGLLDEPAHLATAWLALCALTPRIPPPWLGESALIASVAIDIDHVPLYLTGGRFAVDGARPPTHCLLLTVLLTTVGLACPRVRWAVGAAIGALLHFVRDVATGPGIPLLWPASDTAVLMPHLAYLGTIGGLALVAALRNPHGAARAPARGPVTRNSRSATDAAAARGLHRAGRTKDPRI